MRLATFLGDIVTLLIKFITGCYRLDSGFPVKSTSCSGLDGSFITRDELNGSTSTDGEGESSKPYVVKSLYSFKLLFVNIRLLHCYYIVTLVLHCYIVTILHCYYIVTTLLLQWSYYLC